MARQRLQWPFKGQVDSNARGDQPDLTTSDSQNVRNFAGGTERLQGGQRPGLSKAFAAQVGSGSEPVRHVSSLVYDRPPFDYAQDSGSFSDKWSRKMDDGGYPLAMVVSPRDSQVYITSVGSLVKLNANGVQKWTFPLPVNERTLVPQLQHDGNDIYYVALNDQDGSGGRLMALQEREDQDGVDILFIEELPRGATSDFLYRAGSLFVAANDDAASETFIHAYSTVQTATPTYITAYEAPYPVRQIGYMNGGIVYAADASRSRTLNEVGVGGVQPSQVEGNWTPLDMANYEERIHCWIDAYAMDGIEAGTQADAPDVRQQYLDAAPIAQYPQRKFNDDTPRGFTGKHAGGRKPLYDADGLVIHPGWKFDPLAGSASGRNGRNFRNAQGAGWVTDSDGAGAKLAPKLTLNDKLERSKGLYPRTIGQTWAVTFLCRSRTDNPMLLWVMDQAKGNSDSDVAYNWLALTLNVDETGRYTGTKDRDAFRENSNTDTTPLFDPKTYPNNLPGKWCLYSPDSTLRNEFANPVAIGDYIQHPNQLLTKTSGTRTQAQFHVPNVQQVGYGVGPLNDQLHLVTLVFERINNNHTRVYLRVNGNEDATACYLDEGEGTVFGEVVERFNNKKAYGECLGTRFYERVTGDFTRGQGRVFMGPCEGWDGWLYEAVSYFGDTTTTPHDQSYGNRTAGGFFLDVEKVEAYMAWKWGVASYVLQPPSGARTGNQHDSAPYSTGSTTSNTINLSDGTRISDALSSPLGITGKISAVDGKHQWAYAGSGMGWTVTCDEGTGAIYTTGPQDLSAPSLPSETGPLLVSNLQDLDSVCVARKLVDVGPLAYIRRAGYGLAEWQRCPLVGDTLIVKMAGGTVTRTLEFIADTSPAVPGPTSGSGTAQYPIPSALGAAGLKALLEDLTFVNDYLNNFLFRYYNSSGTGGDVLMACVLDEYRADASRRTMRWYQHQVTSPSPFPKWGTDYYDEPLGKVSGDGLSQTTTASTSLLAIRHQMFAGSLGVRDASNIELNAWSVRSASYGPTYHATHGVCDLDGNWYIAPKYRPVSGVSSAQAAPNDRIYLYNQDGRIDEVAGAANTSYGAVAEWEYTLQDPDYPLAEFGVSCLGLQPQAEYKYPTDTVSGPEYLYACNDNVADDESTEPELRSTHKVALIQRSTNNDPTRRIKHFAVRGPKLYMLDPSSGSPTWADKGTITRGFASGETESYYTSSATVFGEKFFVNNGAYYKYSPVSDTVEAVVAEKGEIPEGCRLTTFYRGRWVVARGDKDPYSIHASAVGDPLNWDFYSLAPKVTDAFSGANQDTASNPDVVNALAPFYDDVLIVGGENSITQYRGDLSSLGEIDYFTDSTGFAFGDSWCLSPSGNLYFFGSRGGIWVMQPKVDARTVPPVEITASTIAEALRDVNLQTHLVRLVWDYAEQGFHVFITPIDADSVSSSQQHWYYCERTKSWWREQFGTTALQPFSAALLAGDTADQRRVAIAGTDGYLRIYDGAASSDDGTLIASKALIGPILPPDTALEARINSLNAVLGNVDTGCSWALYASDDPALPGAAVATGTFTQGRNPRIPARARGSYLWLELSNLTAGGRWAVESIFADIHNAGRKRDR